MQTLDSKESNHKQETITELKEGIDLMKLAIRDNERNLNFIKKRYALSKQWLDNAKPKDPKKLKYENLLESDLIEIEKHKVYRRIYNRILKSSENKLALRKSATKKVGSKKVINSKNRHVKS